MKLVLELGTILLICVVGSRQTGDDEEVLEEGRDLRALNEDWKAVQYFSPTQDGSDWVPQTEQISKRRRIRKRKRRPPIFIQEHESETPKTQSLDQFKEPWEEMREEAQQKSNNRRRLTPIYEESEVKVQAYERIRDPFTALQEAEEKQRKSVEDTRPPDLKTILKQSGGLSLSEVLQQKNLSLAELLKGNRQAIYALVSETETTTTSTEGFKYRRMPPSVGLKKGFHKNLPFDEEKLSSHEILEAQKKRLVLLNKSAVSDQTNDSTKKLPVTNAKLVASSPSPEPISISLEEVAGINLVNNTEIKPSEGPFKMVIDLEVVETTITPQTTNTLSQDLEESPATSTMSASEKSKRVTAKEEIMEILQNPVERAHLSTILRTRNMTVEELVAQRERGSSQLHLADIFHNKTREPEPSDEPFVGHIQPDLEELRYYKRRGKNLVLTPELSSTESSQKQEEKIITNLPYTVTSFPTYKIETNKEMKTQPFLPIWQQLYPNFFSNVYQNDPKTSTENGVESLEVVDNTVDEVVINGRLKTDSSQNVDEEEGFFNIPSGVKSAILASLAIIALSLIVFVTILVVFKWSHKKKRLNYSGSFSGSKIRSPILQPDQRRTFKTFVCETLGKKKNYYKAHVQSMSDSIWERQEKQSYMI